LAEGKDRVIVLDFVTDIRRFAAGLQLDRDLSDAKRGGPKKAKVVTLNSKVTFRKSLDEDLDGKRFLKQWLKDVDAIAEAGEDVSLLTFPEALGK
jgi:hypothetical protein